MRTLYVVLALASCGGQAGTTIDAAARGPARAARGRRLRRDRRSRGALARALPRGDPRAAAPALRQLPSRPATRPHQGDGACSCTIRRSCAAPTTTASPGMECTTCHQDRNQELARVPGAPKWHLAPHRDGVGRQVARAHLRADEGSASATAARRWRRSSSTTRTTSSSRGAGRPGADREPAPGTQAAVRRADRGVGRDRRGVPARGGDAMTIS